MTRRLLSFVLVFALALAGTTRLAGQLPGPPVGAPQANQSPAFGYNFQYAFIPNAADGSGFRVFPTLNTSTITAQTVDLARVGGTIVFPNATSSGTTAAGLHVLIPTVTLNGATVTNAATVVIDGDPVTGTNKYSLWNKGTTRLDGAIVTNTAGAAIGAGYFCGASLAANGACANTAMGATMHWEFGTFLLTGNASTVTGLTAYTSTTTFNCVANDITTRANVVQAIPASTTTVTITNTTGATDLISMICVGY
jgi:hypothetical protein